MNHLIFKQYDERLNRLGRHKSTVTNYRSAVRHLETFMAERGLTVETLEPEVLEGYFNSLPLAPTTRRIHLVEIRAAVRYAHRRGLLRRDPTLDVELGRVSDREIRILSSEQLRLLLAAAQSEPEHTMLMLAVYTGMRRAEIASLDWRNVDLSQNTLQVVGKGGKRRLVPIHPCLSEVLSGLSLKLGTVVMGPNGGNSVASCVGRLRDVESRVGFKVNFHDFRRTVASSLDANGVEEGLIHRIMGWAMSSIFDKHYRHVADKRLQEAILRLYHDDAVNS